MHGPYGLNNIAEQRRREAQAGARRHRLALEAEAARVEQVAAERGGLRRAVDQAGVAVRWAIRALLG